MPKVLGFINHKWFQILTIGAALFFAAEQALKFTNNINFVPTVILLGAFLVPAAFVAYFYSQEQVLDKSSHLEIPLSLVAICFLAGGVVGSIVAGFFEYTTLSSSSVSTLFSAALIEEAAKLIFPIVIFMRGRYRSEADGLFFGVTCGMGFAALETMGYGLTTLLQTQGNVGALQEILLIRGLLSRWGMPPGRDLFVLCSGANGRKLTNHLTLGWSAHSRWLLFFIRSGISQERPNSYLSHIWAL